MDDGKDAVESDIMAAVGNLRMKVALKELCLAKYMDRVALAIADVVTVMVCCLTLKDGVVNQIINPINFEEKKGKSY
jgi:hypothetical protein